MSAPTDYTLTTAPAIAHGFQSEVPGTGTAWRPEDDPDYDTAAGATVCILALNRLLEHPRWAGMDDARQDLELAHMINALPDLLDALEACVTEMIYGALAGRVSPGLWTTALEAHAALAKAKGQTS